MYSAMGAEVGTVSKKKKKHDVQLWAEYEDENCTSTENDKEGDSCILVLLLRLSGKVCWNEANPHNEKCKRAERDVFGFIEVLWVLEAECSQNS